MPGSYAEYYGAEFPPPEQVRAGGTAVPVDSYASYYGAYFPAESDVRSTPAVMTSAAVEVVEVEAAKPVVRRRRRTVQPVKPEVVEQPVVRRRRLVDIVREGYSN